MPFYPKVGFGATGGGDSSGPGQNKSPISQAGSKLNANGSIVPVGNFNYGLAGGPSAQPTNGPDWKPGVSGMIGGYGYQQEESDQKKAADKLAATLAGGNPYDDLNSQVVSPNYTGYGFAGQQSPYQFGGGYGGGQTTNVSDRLVPSLEGIRMQYLLRALGLGG